MDKIKPVEGSAHDQGVRCAGSHQVVIKKYSVKEQHLPVPGIKAGIRQVYVSIKLY